MNEKSLTTDRHFAHNEPDEIGSKVDGADVSDVELGSINQTRARANRKLPYEKPAYRYEKVFVTTALSCGKISGGTGACNMTPKVS
jgi:hypothetical protein